MSEIWNALLGFWRIVFDIVPAWAVYVYAVALWLLWRRHVRSMVRREGEVSGGE